MASKAQTRAVETVVDFAAVVMSAVTAGVLAGHAIASVFRAALA